MKSPVISPYRLRWLPLLATLVGLAQAAAPTPPNILYILADDMGVGEISALFPSRNKIRTPHLDRLAAEGMVFAEAHSGSAVCTPTRYGILTGRYAWRTHLQAGVLWGLSAPLIAPNRTTVAGLLRSRGYHTAAIGKWHLGLGWAGGPSDVIDIDDIKLDYSRRVAHGPVDLGFDYFFGISASLDMAPYVWIENDRVVAPASVRQTSWFRHGLAATDFRAVDVLDEMTRRSVAYIERRGPIMRPADKPFFLYLALTSPHTPIVPAAAWKGRSGHGEYGDFVVQTDAIVGDLLSALERAGIASNTLVVFTSDNGCSATPAKAKELEAKGHFPSGPYRGYKSDLFEGGHHVPFIVRWPARVGAGSHSDRLVCLTDLMATCADLTGAPLPAGAGEDSVSFLPTLSGTAQPARTPIVHHSISGHFALRDGPWKLLLARGSGGWTSPTEVQALKEGLPPVQLYHLGNDSGERTNLAAKNPAVVARLSVTLAQLVALGRSTPGATAANDMPVDLWKSSDDTAIPPPPAAATAR